jgi:hypothetical protein
VHLSQFSPRKSGGFSLFEFFPYCLPNKWHLTSRQCKKESINLLKSLWG